MTTTERRKFTAEDRLSILKEVEREGRATTLRKYSIAPSLYDRCASISVCCLCWGSVSLDSAAPQHVLLPANERPERDFSERDHHQDGRHGGGQYGGDRGHSDDPEW